MAACANATRHTDLGSLLDRAVPCHFSIALYFVYYGAIKSTHPDGPLIETIDCANTSVKMHFPFHCGTDFKRRIFTAPLLMCLLLEVIVFMSLLSHMPLKQSPPLEQSPTQYSVPCVVSKWHVGDYSGEFDGVPINSGACYAHVAFDVPPAYAIQDANRAYTRRAVGITIPGCLSLCPLGAYHPCDVNRTSLSLRPPVGSRVGCDITFYSGDVNDIASVQWNMESLLKLYNNRPDDPPQIVYSDYSRSTVILYAFSIAVCTMIMVVTILANSIHLNTAYCP